jgi:hypothetical protein
VSKLMPNVEPSILVLCSSALSLIVVAIIIIAAFFA